jgi:hypothetical protein
MSFSFLDIDASEQFEERKAARHAAILANTRVASSYGAFLDGSSSPEERKHRMAYIEGDLRATIEAACEEAGHTDIEGVTSAILDRISKGAFCDDCRKWNGCECKKDHEDDDSEVAKDLDLKPGDEDSKKSSFRVAGPLMGPGDAVPQTAQHGNCPQCGSTTPPQLTHGGLQCRDCGYHEQSDPNMDQAPGGINPNRLGKEARRPKLCPYHSELIDASLHAGEPQYSAFSGLVGSEAHCKGAYSGSCNFKPAMVAQQYWDERKEQYEQNRLERERMQNQPDVTFEQVGPTEIVDAPEGLEAEVEGDLSSELAEAPSAVGAGEMVVASDSTGLSDEPSPKMDKKKWKPNALNPDGNLPVIDTDGGRFKTVEQDVTDNAEYKDSDPFEQTRTVTETEDVGKEQSIERVHTDTWTGTEGLADPVTSKTDDACCEKFERTGFLHNIDCPKNGPFSDVEDDDEDDEGEEKTSNRIREYFETQGFTPRDVATQAIAQYEANSA